METPPPPDATVPPALGPPERRCPRCGAQLADDQEWCLNCGAATETEVVEARGWGGRGAARGGGGGGPPWVARAALSRRGTRRAGRARGDPGDRRARLAQRRR